MAEINLFADRVAVIATMHQKEKAIAPLLQKHLGVSTLVPQDFDTDAFGTFTREVARVGSQLETARAKAVRALDLIGETLAIASEGTFGPHPVIPGIPCNRELVFLLDTQNQLELYGQEFSTATNYSHQAISSLAEARMFASKVGFPEHALVVMLTPQSSTADRIIKGINTDAMLEEAIEFALSRSSSGNVHVETDMRALFNPTRMQNIEKATQDLLRKIEQTCPRCDFPGFDIVEQKRGLPCALCGIPTQLIRASIYACQKCKFSQEKTFPQGIETADPVQCNYCNP
jgi:hypothetical protein